MKDFKRDFWVKWYKATSIEREDMVKELPISKVHPEYSNIINSYFVDLAEYLELLLDIPIPKRLI